MIYHVTSSIYAEHLPLIQPSLLVSWLFYNSKNSKLNRSASPFRKRNKNAFSYIWAFVKAPYSASAIAKSRAYRSLHQNPPYVSEDELAGTALTEGSGTTSPTLAVSYAITLIPAIAPTVAPSLDNKLFKKFIKAYL